MSAVSDLMDIMPGANHARADLIAPLLLATCVKYGISSLPQRAAFLASVAHETGQLRYLEELWGPTAAQKRYDPPGSLAAALGNTLVGDGYRYRGRGLLMVTGRFNYKAAGDDLGFDLVNNPDWMSQNYQVACDSAGWFWDKHGLNSIAQNGDIKAVTLAINGGYNGLADREAFYDRAMEVLPL